MTTEELQTVSLEDIQHLKTLNDNLILMLALAKIQELALSDQPMDHKAVRDIITKTLETIG